jgi:chromosome partitioning protein
MSHRAATSALPGRKTPPRRRIQGVRSHCTSNVGVQSVSAVSQRRCSTTPLRGCAAAKIVAIARVMPEGGAAMKPLPPGTIVAVANRKGGVGKTTVATHIAMLAAVAGYRVLFTDTDSQGNGSKILLKTVPSELNLAHVMVGKASLRDVIVPSVIPRLDVAPATKLLTDAMLTIAAKIRRENVLKRALSTVRDDYDLIVIDTPPEAALAMINALNASKYVLMPFTADRFALDGMFDIDETITELAESDSTRARIIGCVQTMADSRQSTDKQWRQDAKNDWGDKVFDATLRVNASFKLCAAHNQSIVEIEKQFGRPPHRGTQDARNLFEEFLSRLFAAEATQARGRAGAAA